MKCKFFGCNAEATHLIVRASNMPVCDEHLTRNILMFGCDLTTTPVKKEPRIECGATGGPGPGGDDNYTDRYMI